MTRRKRIPWWWKITAALREMFAVDDPVRRHRSEGARKGWETRRRNADVRVAEDITRNESARIFHSDPTP